MRAAVPEPRPGSARGALLASVMWESCSEGHGYRKWRGCCTESARTAVADHFPGGDPVPGLPRELRCRGRGIAHMSHGGYREFTAQQKLEIVLAGLRGDRSVKGTFVAVRDR